MILKLKKDVDPALLKMPHRARFYPDLRESELHAQQSLELQQTHPKIWHQELELWLGNHLLFEPNLLDVIYNSRPLCIILLC